MLAPLKDRRLIEQESPAAITRTQGEMVALRLALRESRNRLRQLVREEGKRRAAMLDEMERLREELVLSRQQVERYESGVAIVELGRELLRLQACNDCLRHGQARMWNLEKNLESAHCEYQRLFEERNALAEQVRQLLAVSGGERPVA